LNSIAIGRYVDRGELDSPFRKIAQPILYISALTRALNLDLFPMIIAARHLPHFIYLLNELISKIVKMGMLYLNVLTLKFGTFYSSLQVVDLLVDGLEKISYRNSTKSSRLDIRLRGELSQQNRERIIAAGISTVDGNSDSNSSDDE